MTQTTVALTAAINSWMPELSENQKYDLTDRWNEMVTEMKTDYVDVNPEAPEAETKLPGTGLNPFKLVPSGVLEIPKINVYIPIIGTVDLWDAVLCAWCGWKGPITGLFGIPIPIGSIAYVILRNVTFPFSGLLQTINDGPMSGLESGFTFKDLLIDVFCGWVIMELVKFFGKEAFEYARMLFAWYSKYRAPKIKDIIARVKLPGAEMKYSSEGEPITLYSLTTLFNEAFQLWLAYLTDPMHVSRPS